MTPTGRKRQAFEALHWVGCTLEAALQHPIRRQIIEFIADRHPKAMETTTPISCIEKLAHQAAAAALKTTEKQWRLPAMNHPRIIGLTGPAGCGKDTVADLLVASAGFAKLAFADPLRAEVATAFDIDPEHLQRRETKEHPLSALALRRCRSSGFLNRLSTMHALAGQTLDLDAPRSPRQIMQWWGTDYRRHQHQNYWVRQTETRVLTLLNGRWGIQSVVITDVRFADEAELVRALGGKIWQVERDGVAVAPGGHVSEVSGSEFRPSVVINNSASIGHLQARVLEALAPGGIKTVAA